MLRLFDSHFFRLSMMVFGLLLAPVSAHFINIWWLGGRMSSTFEQITFYAWVNLALTTAIPFIMLSLWTYLIPFVPNISHDRPHRRAHAIAVIVSLVFDALMLFWAHRSIWMSTDPSAASRFIFAPFATLSVQVVLYMVVFWVVFRIGKL